jgi:hypothetical protein
MSNNYIEIENSFLALTGVIKTIMILKIKTDFFCQNSSGYDNSF